MMLQLPLSMFSFREVIITHGHQCHLSGAHPYYQVKICVAVSLLMDPNSTSNSSSNAYSGLIDNRRKLSNQVLK